MTDLFREVDEAMRRDRIAKFFKDNAAYIVVLVVGTIVLTGGLSAYRSWDTNVKQKQTSTIISLQDATDYPANISKFDVTTLRPDLRGITLLSAAGKFMSEKKSAEALALYEKAAADTTISKDMRSLATLMSVRILIDDKDKKGDDLLARLKPIWSDPKDIWAYHARLEAAVITANKLGNPAGAAEHLNVIQDAAGLPETLYEKARALNHVYALKASKAAEEKNGADSKS